MERQASILFLLEQGADRNVVVEDGKTLKVLLARHKAIYYGSGSEMPDLFREILEKMEME